MKIGQFVAELGRGLGLILRDIHRLFYRKIGARIWWVYLAAIFVAFLWATGQLWAILAQILTLLIICLGIGLMFRSLFRKKKKKEAKK